LKSCAKINNDKEDLGDEEEHGVDTYARLIEKDLPPFNFNKAPLIKEF
jgi:hypothetical protein